jgi:outer membrane lipoprotein-sorting protein
MLNRRTFVALALAAAVLVPLGSAQRARAADDLYSRMQHVNSGLRSYQADVTVAIQLHSFPFISPTLAGTAYYKRPDKTAVDFQSVPSLASQLKKVVGQIEPPAEWPSLYEVTPTGDDGTTATFRLVRKKNGRIDHVDVTVDDRTATVSAMTYSYKDDGGTIAFKQTYDDINGNYVIDAQTGKVDIPHYNADVTSKFTNYKVNVDVPDSVFQD